MPTQLQAGPADNPRSLWTHFSNPHGSPEPHVDNLPESSDIPFRKAINPLTAGQQTKTVQHLDRFQVLPHSSVSQQIVNAVNKDRDTFANMRLSENGTASFLVNELSLFEKKMSEEHWGSGNIETSPLKSFFI